MENPLVLVLLLLASTFTLPLLGFHFSSRNKCCESFDQWRRRSGKMLPDYDAEQAYVEKYSK